MEITATPARRGSGAARMLFVRLEPRERPRAIRTLIVTTEPSDDAPDYRR